MRRSFIFFMFPVIAGIFMVVVFLAGGGIFVAQTSSDGPAPSSKALVTVAGDGAQVSDAVEKALDFLQGKQNEDGSWGDHHKSAMTAFSLLCFLGHGETPDSPSYGDTVMNGIKFLVDLAAGNEGLLAASRDRHFPYEHGSATYALGEAYVLAKSGKRQVPGLREAFVKGIEIIIKGQNKGDGGWNYGYKGNNTGDASVGGWQYLALDIAREADLDTAGLDESIAKAKKFFATVRDPATPDQEKEHFYQYNRKKSINAVSNWNMTASCAFGMQVLGDKEKSEFEKEIDGAIDWLMNHAAGVGMLSYGNMQPYGWHFATEVMHRKGGVTWKKWKGIFRDAVLAAQQDDGSWAPTRIKAKSALDKRIYQTSLCTLMLEVDDR